MKSMGRKSAVVTLFLCLLALVSVGYAQRDSISPFTGSNSVVAPTNLEANKCYDCHVKLEDAKMSNPAKEWKEGVHFKNGITCERCHAAVVPAGRLSNYGEFGGSYRDDHMDIKLEADVKAPASFPVEGAVGEYTYVIRKGLTKQQAIAVCARCHGFTLLTPDSPKNVFPDYKTSVHGQSVMVGGFGNPERVGKAEVNFQATGIIDSAVCTDCHNPHETRSKTDPKSSTFKTNIAETCGSEKCHGSDEIAKKYGISNARVGWEENIMFRRGMIGELEEGNIPTCPDCHGGSHKIVSKDDPASPVNVKNRAKTCGKEGCHPAFKDKGEFNVPIHITFPPDKDKYLPEWITFRFMEGLLIGVMAVFLPLFGLDIIRKYEERGKGGEHK